MNKPKITFTVGISASGKSTWAKSQENTSVVERDEIREELYPGYTFGTPDAKKEKVVTQIQHQRIAALASQFKNICVSDTNLNQKYIDVLLNLKEVKAANYKVNYKYFDASFDYSLCLERNQNRERKVPQKVILEQWRVYQNLRGQPSNYYFDTKDKPIVFISDVHGLAGKLKELLYLYRGYRVILSGDINDQRFENLEDNFSDSVSSAKTLQIALLYSNLSDSFHLLHSNHQKNLIEVLRGRRKKLSNGLENTLAELIWHGAYANVEKTKNTEVTLTNSGFEEDSLVEKILLFLETRPHCLGMKHNGVEWRFAHAYIPSSQKDFRPFVSSNLEGGYLYGPNENDKRISWWLEKELQAGSEINFKSCVGHYHTVFEGNNSIVCDPEDGRKLGVVVFKEGEKPAVYEY